VADTWRPTAGGAALRARAELLASVRTFFRERDVLEVETPLLSLATVTDPNMDPIRCGGRWLQTSPEYAMKRLLAAGSGPIYQVCKAFRGGESGSRHNPEFSMLEWYRPGFELSELMAEVAALVGGWLDREGWELRRYRELFLECLDLDPFAASTDELEDRAGSRIELSSGPADRDGWLDLLFTHLIEPELESMGLVFVTDYPASQAALARVDSMSDYPVAERFELYVDGLELAGGYRELTDPAEQRRRFRRDNRRRVANGGTPRAIDERLLAALDAGLPECCGVALGLDRLLMLKLGRREMRDVLGFSWDRA